MDAEPAKADIAKSMTTNVEERWATTRTAEQASARYAAPAKVDVAKSTQAHVEERAATRSTSEQASTHTLASASVDAPPATAPEEPHAPESAWARAVAKLRSWQTEKGGRRTG